MTVTDFWLIDSNLVFTVTAGERLRVIEDENRRLNEHLNQCMEEIIRLSGQGRSVSVSDSRRILWLNMYVFENF